MCSFLHEGFANHLGQTLCMYALLQRVLYTYLTMCMSNYYCIIHVHILLYACDGTHLPVVVFLVEQRPVHNLILLHHGDEILNDEMPGRQNNKVRGTS